MVQEDVHALGIAQKVPADPLSCAPAPLLGLSRRRHCPYGATTGCDSPQPGTDVFFAVSYPQRDQLIISEACRAQKNLDIVLAGKTVEVEGRAWLAPAAGRGWEGTLLGAFGPAAPQWWLQDLGCSQVPSHQKRSAAAVCGHQYPPLSCPTSQGKALPSSTPPQR